MKFRNNMIQLLQQEANSIQAELQALNELRNMTPYEAQRLIKLSVRLKEISSRLVI